MSTLIDLMMAVRKGHPVFYHKDTNQFDYLSYSESEYEKFDENKFVSYENTNSIMFPTYEEIDAYLEKLRELELFDDFTDACGDIYAQIFEEWCDKYKLEFK